MPGTSQAWPHPTTLDAQERLGDWCGRGKGSHYVLSRVSPAPTPVPSLVWGNQGTANLVAGWVPPYEALVQVRSARKGCAISTAQASPGKLPDIPRLGETPF